MWLAVKYSILVPFAVRASSISLAFRIQQELRLSIFLVIAPVSAQPLKIMADDPAPPFRAWTKNSSKGIAQILHFRDGSQSFRKNYSGSNFFPLGSSLQTVVTDRGLQRWHMLRLKLLKSREVRSNSFAGTLIRLGASITNHKLDGIVPRYQIYQLAICCSRRSKWDFSRYFLYCIIDRKCFKLLHGEYESPSTVFAI